MYAILPAQVNTLILGFQQRQDAVIAELYAGKITFGEYNVNMNRIAGEVAAQWLFEASELNKRAIEFDNAGRYSDAEPLYKQSLAMREEVLGTDDPYVAEFAEQSCFSIRRARSATPLQNHCTSDHWQSKRKPLVPIIPK